MRRCVDSKFVKLSDELIIFIESQEDILNKQKNRSNVYMANYLPRCRQKCFLIGLKLGTAIWQNDGFLKPTDEKINTKFKRRKIMKN